jgi:hypothetical protein
VTGVIITSSRNELQAERQADLDEAELGDNP